MAAALPQSRRATLTAMLHLHQSHRLETLLSGLADVVRAPQPDPFAAELVVVQSKGMGRWISLRLAERHGVCANVQFPLPASFLWQLLRLCFGELPERSAFAPEVLVWRIRDWLEQSENAQQTPRLAAYLNNGDERRRQQLAERLADVFDQYLVYRPDWIEAWEGGRLLELGTDEAWQAALWRHLAADQTDSHRARVVGRLLQRLGDGSPMALPRRVSVFGVSSLPPVFLDVLQALSQRVDVHVYALNPCREYWGEIRDEREIARAAGERSVDDLYLEVGHPLLASLGKQGRDFFDRLAEFPQLDSKFSADDAEPPRSSLLEVLQADILELHDRRRDEPWPLAADDDSLQVHVCHGPMREVEVLHDRLLHLFQRHPDLQPGDVAVLTPDIGLYAPYVDAVFSRRQGEPFIPYSIADRGLSTEQPLLEVFLALLDLPDSRYPADWVLGLMEHPAVLRRFGLEPDDLDAIRHWLHETGVRWGRDGEHKAGLGLPPMARHTWREGLSRLLLGYSMPGALAGAHSGPPLYAGLLPYDDVEGSRAQTLGRLAAFAETLFQLAEQLARPHSLAQWAECLGGLIERLFDPLDEEQAALQNARDALDLLAQLGEQAGYRRPVGLAVVKHWLSGELSQSGGGSGFLTGGVTFCTMVPMRNLPFRVLCLVGLDEGAFPRRQRPSGFDLMARNARRGDRSRRADDRYLFLEALLSARQVLYLSYRGRDARDNGERPPSVLLEELLDTVRLCCVGDDGGDPLARIVVTHPLQPFSPRYFQGDERLASYSTAWLAAARLAGRGEDGGRPLFDAELPEAEAEWFTVEPDDLAWFYTNPARYLLEKRLGLRLERAEAQLPVREPFGLDFFAAQDVRADVLRLCLAGGTKEDGLALADAKGWLPHGAFGAALFDREEVVAAGLAERLAPLLPPELLEPLPVSFHADGVALTGWLKNVSPQGLLDWTPDKLRPRHVLKLWLRHLLLCLLRPDGVSLRSRLEAVDDSLCFGPVDDAEAQLARLLSLYRQGLRKPLPFFLKSSFAYAQKQAKPPRGAGDAESIRAAALQAAWDAWHGAEFGNGFPESANSYYQAVYRGGDPLDEAFEALAVDVFAPMLRTLVGEEPNQA